MYKIQNPKEADTRFIDLSVEDPDDLLVDVVGVSWGLTTIGKGKASFTHPESAEAETILRQAKQKIDRRSDAVTDDWMKHVMHACGLVTNKANNKHVECVSYFNSR